MANIIKKNPPKVSVIIPVYGVERYIERCARSLFEQTIDDIEYLFIDDCSTDNSITVLQQVAKEYPEREHQIKIVRMDKNSGQAAARRRGIEESTGEFVIHCDGDDWVEIEMYEKMYVWAQKMDADIIKCGFQKVYENRIVNSDSLPALKRIDRIQLLSWLFEGKDMSSLCDKLVRRSLYMKIIDYPTDNMWEDVYLCTQLIAYCQNFINLNECYYKYRIQDQSIVHKKDIGAAYNRLNQSYNNVCKVENFLKLQKIDGYLALDLDCLKNRVKNQLLPFIYRRDVYIKWKQTFSEINYRLLVNKRISNRSRLVYIVTLLGLYPYIFRNRMY